MIQFVNPYFYEVSAIKVFSDDLQPGLINDIDDMRINLLKAYAHTRCEFNLSDDYLFFAIPLETTGKHLMPLYPGNISIEGIWASEFFLYYSLLYKVSFYGSSGCTCIFDVQLLGFAKAEGLSDLLDGRSLTMKIRSIPATIVFEQTSDLEKFVDFLK